MAALIVGVIVPLLLHAHTYAPNSVLQSGSWVKIRVSESGVCKISYEELQSAGIKPEKVRVYGYGGAMLKQDFTAYKIDDLPAVGFWMEKGADGVFGSGDYILFYAQGPISWSYNGSRFVHTRNPYSDYGYYFLSDNAGQQKLLTSAAPAIDGSGAVDVTSYSNYQVHELDLVNLLDPEKGIDGGGREFYGESFSPGSRASISFTMPNIITSVDLDSRVALAAKSSMTSTFTIQLNGTQRQVSVTAIAPNDFHTMAETGLGLFKFPASSSSTQTMSIHYNNGISTAAGYLNYVELTAQCKLTMVGSYMPFRTNINKGSDTPIRYTIDGADGNTQVWNITRLDTIYRVPTEVSGGKLSFYGSNENGIQEYVAVNPKGNSWISANTVGSVRNQNLHKLNNIDYVIITPASFVSQATRLAKAHEQYDHITTAVVTDEQVYNEFSSGTPDASAYRWIMKMLYDRGEGANHKPSNLLLFGDGTFDNRQLLVPKGGKVSTGGAAVLLTYQAINSTAETKAYATDDYFGFMHDNEGEIDMLGTMEIGVGRLPIITSEEADHIVNKLITYMTENRFGSWKNQMLFLSDDGDSGLHIKIADEAAEIVRTKNPDFVVNKVYLDSYQQETTASGESYPIAKNRLDNLLNSGVLYFNYSGHGGYNAITNESMLDLRSIRAMRNANQAFWMFATCSFSHFDSGKRCAAEEAVLNEKGGAIGVMSACRTVFASNNRVINANLCDTLFAHKNSFSYVSTLGEASRSAKNKTGPADDNKLPYILLGDPALRLAYPTEFNVQTTSCSDTIRALTTHKVQGQIIDSTNTLMDWFNGKVHVIIYDKLQRLTTRDNDAKSEDKKETYTFNDYPNIIFRSDINVKNGKFEFVFMTPKDIRYNYGNGRMVYYAYDEENKAEAVGHYEDMIIGGSSSVVIQDTIGPEITMYLNNPAFINFGITHEHPHFYAQLEDEHGINTVGSGIGHDLLMIVDEQSSQTYVLNEYFSNTDGDYRKGVVDYKMPPLEEGDHVMTFRAWDLCNNSSTEKLYFTVVKGLNTQVFSMVTYPNPVSMNGTVHMRIEYDRPDDLVQTDVYVYNPYGQLVWHHSQEDAKEIEWNIGQMGITTGLYTYRVILKTEDTSAVSKTGKIIVTK